MKKNQENVDVFIDNKKSINLETSNKIENIKENEKMEEKNISETKNEISRDIIKSKMTFVFDKRQLFKRGEKITISKESLIELLPHLDWVRFTIKVIEPHNFYQSHVDTPDSYIEKTSYYSSIEFNIPEEQLVEIKIKDLKSFWY